MAKRWQGVAAGALLFVGGGAKAALVDAGNGLVHDTVLDITWAADASLSGRQNWSDLVQWAEDLVYGGYDDWRLASTSVSAGTPTGSTSSIVDCRTDTEENCRDNELGYMYTHYLPGNYGDDKTGDQTVGSVTLTGIQNAYWGGAEFSASSAGLFITANGVQANIGKGSENYGWAVRSGQVAAASLPGTALLMALGLMGLGAARLRRRAPSAIRSLR